VVEEGKEFADAIPSIRPRFPLSLCLYMSDSSSKGRNGEGGEEEGRKGGIALVNLDAPSLPVDVYEKGREAAGGGGLPSLPPFLPGRPDLHRLLEAWGSSQVGKKGEGGEGWREERRGVVVCGPEGMLREVREAVDGSKGRMDMHEEMFKW